jgi:hypothetical protein
VTVSGDGVAVAARFRRGGDGFGRRSLGEP